MKFEAATKSWRETHATNRWLLLANMGLICCVLLILLGFPRTSVVTRLIPHGIQGPIEVAQTNADESYYKSFSLYLATMIGNVSPGNVSVIKEAIEPMLASGIRQPMLDILADQTQTIMDEGVTMTYRPRQVLFDPEQQKSWVTGIQVRRNREGTEDE